MSLPVREMQGIGREAAGPIVPPLAAQGVSKAYGEADEAVPIIADLSFTMVVDGNLVKVLAWYDNEMGYTHALVEHVAASAQYVG